jgi:hypothetical protein
MAETFEELQLPETKLYRVRGVGATFVKPRKTVGGDGKPTVTYVADLAPGGAIVDLIAPEAERLQALGAVVPAEAPKGYDELGRPELEILATQRGVTVRSTGADPQNPLDEDYRTALALFDLGSDSALVGAASNPGGVVTMSDQGVSPVLVDGVHPSPATEQDAETHAVTESDFLPSSRRPDTLGGSVFDARGKSAAEVSEWISSERPNAETTVAAAHNDPDAARVLVEAENAAHENDGRSTVVARLKRIADGEQQG